jgi:hypothetical protein
MAAESGIVAGVEGSVFTAVVPESVLGASAFSPLLLQENNSNAAAQSNKVAFLIHVFLQNTVSVQLIQTKLMNGCTG